MIAVKGWQVWLMGVGVISLCAIVVWVLWHLRISWA